MASALFPDAQNAAVDFTTILYWSGRPFSLHLLLNEHSEFWVPGIIFLLYSFFLQSAFLPGAPLITTCSYCWLLDALRFYRRRFSAVWPIFGKCFFRDWRLALRESLDSSCFNLFCPFFPFMLYFYTVVATVYICSAIVYFCPLSMFWSWWIPMVRFYRFSTLDKETTRSTTKPQ